ncbi:MAG: hypothetical protein OSB65_18425 [Roseibacillus sp.]|nr:hypothetical protein [Roseibacillus sp.]
MSELIEMLIPAVEEQITSAETPFVKDAYQRLLKEPDIDEEEAKKMIALCLADESERMMDDDREFNLERYKTLLSLLPTLPE